MKERDKLNFQGLQAKYRRLYQESAAWNLLQARNAPQILAFLSDLFAEDSEVPFSRARVTLEAELVHCRELGIWETETSAGTYLNQWISLGWLREMDDKLTKTDASEIAIRFCKGLDERTSGTTASHLRIVQDAIRDFVVAISSSADERITLLEYKRDQIQQEINNLRAGVLVELTEADQRERIREIYQLASVLTGDFRRLEDEIRQLDQKLRVQIIEGDSTRGQVLLSIMEKEALLSATEAGSAFESFFHLLCDQNRTTELREQLRNILSQPVSEHLTPVQRQFLSHLMRELNKESHRVFQIRRRTEEGLRVYIESGAAYENRAVDKLLGQIERVAVELRNSGCDLQIETSLSLPTGVLEFKSPESMRLKSPNEKLDTSGVKEKQNSREPSPQILECLDTVRIRSIAHQTLETLREYGPMSIGSIVNVCPIHSGLEELIAYLRVAKSVGATLLEERESIEVNDKHGVQLRASIPTYLLSAELFPEHLDELVL